MPKKPSDIFDKAFTGDVGKGEDPRLSDRVLRALARGVIPPHHINTHPPKKNV